MVNNEKGGEGCSLVSVELCVMVEVNEFLCERRCDRGRVPSEVVPFRDAEKKVRRPHNRCLGLVRLHPRQESPIWWPGALVAKCADPQGR